MRPTPAAPRRRSAAAGGGPSCGTSALATRERRGPRAAAEDVVALAEEDLGVLAVGVGGEAGVAVELRRGPLPRVAQHAERDAGAGRRPTGCGPRPVWSRFGRQGREPPLGPGRRLLPLGLGREPGSVGSGEGVGLEPGEVDHRLVGMQGRPAVDAPLPPSVRAGGPALRVGDVVVLLPRPALVGPPLAALVAAALDEAQEGGVGDRGAADAEGGEVAPVARALVVVGEALVRRAHRERPGGDVDGLEAGGAGRRGAAGRGRSRPGAVGSWASSIACSIVSLCWCSCWSTISWTSPGPSRSRIASARARTLGEVVDRLGAVEDRQVAADGARRLERVVHRGELGVQQRLAAVAVDEPQVLVGGDVREIPRERAHQRGVRGLHLLVGERLDHGERALARLGRGRRRSRWRRARTLSSKPYGIRYAISPTRRSGAPCATRRTPRGPWRCGRRCASRAAGGRARSARSPAGRAR